MPDLSIIIPTYNESSNVRLLTVDIQNILHNSGITYDIWFMDDSSDHTTKVLEYLASEFTHVNYIHRTGEKSLSRAVEEGIQLSHSDYVIVMDADLQHPPEMILEMMLKLKSGYDIVIPSRFITGGADKGSSPVRRAMSFVARILGRLFIKKIRGIRDCTSGFFGFDRRILNAVILNSISWKILIEILVKGHYTRFIEIPYIFKKRNDGLSKISIKQQWRYVMHLANLIIYQ